MRKKALLVTSILIVILALVFVTVIGCTPTEDTYTVTLNLGDSTEDRQMTNLKVAPVAPEKDGYEFEAWYTDAELQNAATFPMELNSNLTLYAKYLKKYTLTLVSMGSENTTLEVAKLKLAPTPPDREGYTFNGWYLDSSYKKAVEYPYVLEKNTTFYARWVAGEGAGFTVEFNTNGGTAIKDGVYSVIEKSPETTKEGFIFAGWFTNSRLVGNAISFPYEVTKHLTLYAKWEKDEGQTGDYTYVSTYKNAQSALKEVFAKFPERERYAVLDLQTTMTTDNGTAKIDMQGNFNVGGNNEFMFRISMLDQTTFAVYFIGNEMYMDVGGDQPIIHFTDIKPDYVIAFLGDLLIDLDLEQIFNDLKASASGMDIAGMLVNLFFNSPKYTSTTRNSDGIMLNETYSFEIKLNSLVSGISDLISMVNLKELIGFDLNLTPLFTWLNGNIPLLKVYLNVNLEYDEAINTTAITNIQLAVEDNDPNNDVDGEVFSWMVDVADIRPGNEADLIEFPEIEETREFSLSSLQFDLDLQLYSDEDGLDVAKLVNLFAPDLNLPEDTLILKSEFGYRLKANIDLDLNYENKDEDNNLIALEIYAIDEAGNIILNEKVPMLLGIYYRNGSMYVSLNSMMPNYWKANNIRIDGVNLKGVVSYLVEMVTKAIDTQFGTNWDEFKSGASSQELNLASGRDVITVADDGAGEEDVVFISPTIQTLIFAVASVVGFQEAVYATGDQIVIELNQKLFSAINQFMGDSPIELPIALDGKLALNIYEDGIESLEIRATVGVPDKDGEGNNVTDENGNLVTSDPVEVGLKAHNFMIGFAQNEFMDGTSKNLDEYIQNKLSQTTYTNNLGEILESVLSGVDLNAKVHVTFNQGTYAIGKFLEGLGIPQLEGMPLEWYFEDDFNMNVALSIMISLDKTTRSNSMFAIEITALDDIEIGSITGMSAGTVMLGVYGFYSQVTSSSGGTGEWKPHILLDLQNVKIMNITLPKLSIEFDFVQALLDMFDNIKIGGGNFSDYDIVLDIMSLFGSDDSGSVSEEVAEGALFAESDGTAQGTVLSDFGGIVLGLNAEKIYASLTLAAVGNLLKQVGVDLGDFDLGAIDLSLDMDITRTDGWQIEASGNFMLPEENQSDPGRKQNFTLTAEIGTQDYPLTVGYVRGDLLEIKNRVQAEVSSYTDDLIQAIINTVGFLTMDIELDLQTFDSHVDFTNVINNILISQGQYLDLPIDLYLDDWSSVSTLTLKWDLDLDNVSNSKLLLAFQYGEKEILSLGIAGGDIVIDLRGLGLFAFKMTNSNLVNLLMGYINDMIADIGDLNLSDIINGLLTPDETVDTEQVAGEVSQGLALAEASSEEDETMDLIMLLLSGIRAENVNLFVDLTADTIDSIFKSLLGISLGFDAELHLALDMVKGEISLGLGLSDVAELAATFGLQVGKINEDDEVFVDTTVSDIDSTTGETMARTLLDRLDIALSIDVLNNNVDTGATNKFLRLSVEKLKADRILSDAAKSPTIPQGAFLVTVARVDSDDAFNNTSVTSNVKSLAYIALNYYTGKMSIYLAKNNISLVVDLGDYVAIDVDLDLVATLGPVFQNLIDQIDAMALGTQEVATMSESESQALALADGTTESGGIDTSGFAALFADFDVLKLLNGGIDIRLTSAGVFNVDVEFNAYEINRILDGVMSLIFGPDTILDLSVLAPDMFGSNYLANVNWDRVHSDERGFWQTLKAQLTPMLREVVTNMVSSALSPLITDTLLNNTYEEIHDILMRLLPLPVFNRFNVGITTLEGTFSNLYIKGYDDNEAVMDEDGTILSNTTQNGGTRITYYDKGTRNANYKTEIYLFNKSNSVGDPTNTVTGESVEGLVDWGDITLSVNFEPYEYSGNEQEAYSQLYNKYFANKTARYQNNATVQKANVTFKLDDGTVLTSSTMDKLNVVKISNEMPATATEPQVVNVTAEATFGTSTTRTLSIKVNILPRTSIKSIEPIEVHAYDELVDEITLNLTSGVSRNVRTEDMTTFTYSPNSYGEHSKQVNVVFKDGTTAQMTVHFLDSTVVDIVGSSEPNTFDIDMYEFTQDNRTIEQFTPEYLYIKYSDGATSRILVDQWAIPTETTEAIVNKAATDMSSVNVSVDAYIAQGTAAAQKVTLHVNVKTKEISALGLGNTLDSLEINPYTYYLSMIGKNEVKIIPDTVIAYYYEEATQQSYNEQVKVNIGITRDMQGNNFDDSKLTYLSEGKYTGTVELDKTKYGERTGLDPEDTEGYDNLAPGYFGWTRDITVNVVKNTIIAVYFDEELTEESKIFTVHPYEYNAMSDEEKLSYFPSTAYVMFSSNAVYEMPIRWYDGSGAALDPLTYVPEYDSYSEQWQIEIGFVTDEFATAATQNGVDPADLQTRFLQKANVGVFVDGMAIEKLNIAGGGEGDDYYEIDPIRVLYLGEDPFPSAIEVTYADGETTAVIGVYQWVGVDDIDISMSGSDVREITVMLTKDGLNNYTVRYKVASKPSPTYAYSELVLDPFGYVTVTEGGQSVNTFKEFGDTLDVVFERTLTPEDMMPLANDVYKVRVQSWDLNRITLSSGETGVAIAKVERYDGVIEDVSVPVRMKTISTKADGKLDLTYEYYGYDFIVVLYNTDTGKFFANFEEDVEVTRRANIDLTVRYWCEEDVQLYTGEVTPDIEDMIVQIEGKNYLKIYTTRSINVRADFKKEIPTSPDELGVNKYYLDDQPDSAANSIASNYNVPVSFSDCGGRSYEYDMNAHICVMGKSTTSTTEGN